MLFALASINWWSYAFNVILITWLAAIKKAASFSYYKCFCSTTSGDCTLLRVYREIYTLRLYSGLHRCSIDCIFVQWLVASFNNLTFAPRKTCKGFCLYSNLTLQRYQGHNICYYIWCFKLMQGVFRFFLHVFDKIQNVVFSVWVLPFWAQDNLVFYVFLHKWKRVLSLLYIERTRFAIFILFWSSSLLQFPTHSCIVFQLLLSCNRRSQYSIFSFSLNSSNQH